MSIKKSALANHGLNGPTYAERMKQTQTATEQELIKALRDTLAALNGASTYIPSRYEKRTGGRYAAEKAQARAILEKLAN